MKNPPNKPQKSNGDLVSGLLKHIDCVMDNVRDLEAHQSLNPHVDKSIRYTLDIACHETKKLVGKIRAERPEITDAPADSTSQKEYLRNAHTWCVGLLYWEDGERIGVEKATTDLASEKPAEKEQNTKRIIAAILISLLIICVFVLSVWLVPLTPFTWLKNHPNNYSLQGSIICLIPCLVVGLFKAQWRNWCWGTAVMAFLVLILSLLGGRSSR